MKTYPENATEMPLSVNDPSVVYLSSLSQKGQYYLSNLRKLSTSTDETLAQWLTVSPRTLRNYQTSKTTLKEAVRERIILVLTLYHHGMRVFKTVSAFETWLRQPNFFFDGKKPESFISTVSGIYFLDERLSAMEHGENI